MFFLFNFLQCRYWRRKINEQETVQVIMQKNNNNKYH